MVNCVFQLKPSPVLQAPGNCHQLGLAYGHETWAYPTNSLLATVAFLLLLDTNLLPQAGSTHYSQLPTLQHSTKLLFFLSRSKLIFKVPTTTWGILPDYILTNLIINALLDANTLGRIVCMVFRSCLCCNGYRGFSIAVRVRARDRERIFHCFFLLKWQKPLCHWQYEYSYKNGAQIWIFIYLANLRENKAQKKIASR